MAARLQGCWGCSPPSLTWQCQVYDLVDLTLDYYSNIELTNVKKKSLYVIFNASILNFDQNNKSLCILVPCCAIMLQVLGAKIGQNGLQTGTVHVDNFETRVDRGLDKTNIYIYLQYIRYIYIHNSGMRMSQDDDH